MQQTFYVGPAGLPKNDPDGIDILADDGLNAAEIPFTYSVWMDEERAQRIGKRARERQVRLSVHASYFVNLAALEEEKRTKSRERILQASRIAYALGARHVVFHAGYYLNRDPESVFQIIKNEIQSIQKTLHTEGVDIYISPETTGKPTQFGSLDELMRLRKETGCSLCVDFAHLEARTAGDFSYEDALQTLADVKDLHCHFSGIEYTQKGERRHIVTPENRMQDLFSLLVGASNKEIAVINESPEPFDDACRMKQTVERLQQK
jgi:deoxyribonuclease-4